MLENTNSAWTADSWMRVGCTTENANVLGRYREARYQNLRVADSEMGGCCMTEAGLAHYMPGMHSKAHETVVRMV